MAAKIGKIKQSLADILTAKPSKSDRPVSFKTGEHIHYRLIL
jgi:hypothetical protein